MESLWTFLNGLGFFDIIYSPIGEGRQLKDYIRYDVYGEWVHYKLYNKSIDGRFEDVDIAKFSDPFDYMSLKAYVIKYEELWRSIRGNSFVATSPNAIDLSKRLEDYKGFAAKLYVEQYIIRNK